MMLTWRAPDVSRMESVRVQMLGNRIKASGRIVAAAAADYPAFNAYYDLQTDDAGAVRRIGLRVATAERDRQLSIARDEENMWMVTNNHSEGRAAFGGALDVDVVPSLFFTALSIRRLAVQDQSTTVTAPVICLSLPDLALSTETVSYRNTPDGIAVASPSCRATLTVDADGFTVDCPGLAERI